MEYGLKLAYVPGKWVMASVAPIYHYGHNNAGWGLGTLTIWQRWLSWIKIPIKCPTWTPHVSTVGEEEFKEKHRPNGVWLRWRKAPKFQTHW